MLKTFEAHQSNYLQDQPNTSQSSNKTQLKLRQMFQKTTKTATFSGEKTPANVPKNSKPIIPLHRCKGKIEILRKSD